MLNILVPTHGRRESFFRCIDSIRVLDNIDMDIEIIVNCDDDSITQEDIDKIDIGRPVSLFNFQGINEIYRDLYDQATGDFVMYLEDDDIIAEGILKSISLLDRYSAVISLYRPYRKDIIHTMLDELREDTPFKPFIPEFFQLSQVIFEKIPIVFPTTYCHQNDELILAQIIESIDSDKINYNKNIAFIQGVDGQNLSLEDIDELC